FTRVRPPSANGSDALGARGRGAGQDPGLARVSFRPVLLVGGPLRFCPGIAGTLVKPTLIVRTIAAGSRPTLAHQASSTRLLRVQSAGGRYGAFQPSANRAAVRSVRFSPAPPIHRGSRAWIGFGLFGASTKR